MSSPPLVSRSMVAAFDDALFIALLMRDVEKAPTQDDDTTASTKATFLANFIVQKLVTNNCEQSVVAPLPLMILRQMMRVLCFVQIFVIGQKPAPILTPNLQNPGKLHKSFR